MSTMLIVAAVVVAVGLVAAVLIVAAASKSKDIRHKRVTRQRRREDTSIDLVADDADGPSREGRQRHHERRRSNGLKIDLFDEDQGGR